MYLAKGVERVRFGLCMVPTTLCLAGKTLSLTGVRSGPDEHFPPTPILTNATHVIHVVRISLSLHC